MWSSRALSYGGLARRYRDFPNCVLRCLDPLRGVSVAFSTELKYENWLLYWADPLIREIQLCCPWFECVLDGQRTRVRPDLVIVHKQTEIQLVVSRRTEGSVRRTSALVRVAQARGFEWSVRTHDDIRGCPVLLRNLNRLRQCAVMFADDVTPTDLDVIANLLPRNEILTRREVSEMVPACVSGDLLDALLIHLHWRGRVSIDLNGGVYADESHVWCR